MSLAIVLPRYGENLGGGAEALVKSLVENLVGRRGKADFQVREVEVWTTCAVDHRTWENYHPPGRTVEGGVAVTRFPVDPRDLGRFISYELRMRDGWPLSVDEQLDWLANGVNSKALYAHISEHVQHFDAVLFAPYLFSTSFWGALIAPNRSLLVPCLHDEHYAYLEVFRLLFSRVRGVIFNSKPEAELALNLYALEDLGEKSAVVGMGFEGGKASGSTERVVPANGRIDLIPQNPYLLYSGRKEEGKNLGVLIECFRQYRERNPETALELLIIGSGKIEFLAELPAGVKDLGFVSEGDKMSLMQNALALCQPSQNESFSIVIMEAWLNRTPVIVHAGCPVTRGHVIASGGGLAFADAEEFSRVLDLLLGSPELRIEMGLWGKRYVEHEYCWEAVNRRLYQAFKRFGLCKVLESASAGV